MTEVKVNMENLSKEERNLLMTLIEKGNKTKSKAWKPKINERYFYLTSMSEIYSIHWANNACDKARYLLGNCFTTRKEIEFERERLKVIAELKRFAEENNDEMNWHSASDLKYHLCYDYSQDIVAIAYCFSCRHNDIYFSSKEIAKKAIETIGEDRIKEFYLGVKKK